ncbi:MULTISPECIES: nucleotide sugar dehydrogenase [Haloferax]|uniref:UDP-N-acetyl-D-mannosamine dehydrogenase n=1 Tax=Haloferax marinum TaxID=2666143 RepID=A0A6A8GAJ9_9EURY|nr:MULTISPECIES: nucleotide sugar dehydrogenase [Haloferax]KAB1198206.1 nucleotide sugar dehydrogenase [Haloferax sp. CBA1150]MRW97293.1 nucleotide sugar dehydrogenase [Haloferax marinum]
MSTKLADKLYGSERPEPVQREALTNGQIPVAVYGLGKMGLPLASVYAETTGNVTGADVDPDVVETINSGGCHVKREPGLDAFVSELVADESLTATPEPRDAAARANVHVVIVPTPITDEHEPDLAILDAVVEDIATGLSRGDLVIIECTVPPQTTAHRVRSTLESKSGLELGEFGLAFCPERTSSGRALEDIRGAYPKVVGGADNESTRAATLIYEEINSKGVLPVSDTTTAEAVKVFEGLYRDVNIALANELATMTDELGIDVNEAIEVANTQPFCNIHDPGPGVGGHCIPFYPYFVIEPFETETPLIETARAVNDSMPQFAIDKLREEFDAEGMAFEDSSILLLGLTYRPGVEEIRASPSLDIAAIGSEWGADMYGVDPMLDDTSAFDLTQLDLEDIYEQSFDAVVMVTHHDDFDDIRWDEISRSEGQLVVIDGRDTLDLDGSDHRVYTIGGGYV